MNFRTLQSEQRVQTITDELWVLQTTVVIENTGIMNKAVLKWQAQTTVYKTKAQFIVDFNKAHKEYLSLLKLTTTPIAHNIKKTNDELGALHSLKVGTKSSYQ